MLAHSLHPVPVTAVILAGGRGARLGGLDKPLVEVAGKPLIEHLLARLHPQVEQIAISANRHIERYAAYGLPVFEDDVADFQGPLAGMHAALYRCRTKYALFVPGDAPLVDPGYAARLYDALVSANARAVVAVADGRLQPVHCLLARELCDSIAALLPAQSSVTEWLNRVGAIAVDCSDMANQFINLNTAEELPLLAAALGDPAGESR